MSISKERFEQIALELTMKQSLATELVFGDYEAGVYNFAHALIKAVEAESGVVGWLNEGELYEVEQRRLYANGGGVFPNQSKLIAIPLVSEE